MRLYIAKPYNSQAPSFREGPKRLYYRLHHLGALAFQGKPKTGRINQRNGQHGRAGGA